MKACRVERKLRLQNLLERCEPPLLSENVVWTTLSFCDLQDCGHAACVSRTWRRAAESQILSTLRSRSQHVLRTRWAATTLGSDDVDLPTERVRAEIRLSFDWERGTGPVIRSKVDLVRAVFAFNMPDSASSSASPMCFFNTLPLAGHRIYRQTWLAGSKGDLEQRSREFPWSDAERRFGCMVDHVPDEDLPEAPTAQLRSERTRYKSSAHPLVASSEHQHAALSALSTKGFDGWLSVRLACQPHTQTSHCSNKRARPCAPEAILTLLPTHARVSIGRAHCDCFYGDDVEGWGPLNRLLEQLSKRREERRVASPLRPWLWSTEPLPLASDGPYDAEKQRFVMYTTRKQLIENALRGEGLRWNTIDRLREVDYLTKDALRFGGRDGDFLAKQLGFTANRHRHALDLPRLVQYVRAAEERYTDTAQRFAQNIGSAPRLRVELTSQVTQAMRCPVQQELALALAWKDVCSHHKGCPPPRPRHTGLVPNALLSCCASEEFAKKLTEDEVLAYKRQVGGPKADAILLSRCLLHTTAY